MAEEATPSGGETATDDASPPSGGRTATEFRAVADGLRNRVDLFGKTLAAVATLGTTAVGLSKIGDLFPAESGWDKGWAVAACVGLMAAGLAAIGVAVRLMTVARPIFMRDDLDDNSELDDAERAEVRPVFEAAARRFGYASLTGLQERERSLRNAASRATDKDERARRMALADAVKTEIEQALARGQVVVIRRRATNAVSGRHAWYLYLAVILGLVIFAAGTDWVSSNRRDRVAEAKACGEARTGGATAKELKNTNGVCEAEAKKLEEKAKPLSAAEARAQIAEILVAASKACAALVHKDDDPDSGPLTPEDCAPVRRAVSEIDP